MMFALDQKGPQNFVIISKMKNTTKKTPLD